MPPRMYDKLTKDFYREEFLPRAKNPLRGVPVDYRLVTALQELRDIVNAPLRITSGFRPNDTKSYHGCGMAADVACSSRDLPDFFNAALRVQAFYFGGIGVYPNANFLHLDVRPVRARWGCFVNDEYVSFSALPQVYLDLNKAADDVWRTPMEEPIDV